MRVFLFSRSCGEKFGFASSIETKKITALAMEPDEINMEDVEKEVKEIMEASAADLQALKDEDVDMTEVKVMVGTLLTLFPEMK